MSAVHWIASWIARDWCSLGGRVEDGLGATKWRAKATSSLKRAKWFPVVPFHIYMSHKAAKSMAKRIWFSQSYDQCTSAGQVMPESQSAACREDMAIWRPPKYSWMLDTLEKEAWVKVDCSTFKNTCAAGWSIDVASYQMAMPPSGREIGVSCV